MQYLISMDGHQPFLTHWFDVENHFTTGRNQVVYDLINQEYMDDELKWKPIEIDHL